MATQEDLIAAKKACSESQAARDNAEIEANAITKKAALADEAVAAAEKRKADSIAALATAEQSLADSIIAVAKAKAEVAKAEADKAVAEGIK